MSVLFAEAPALPLHTAGPYVAAAYIVFLLVVLVYVWIMARKLASSSRELRDLRAKIEEREADALPADDVTGAPVSLADDDSRSQLESTEKGAPTEGSEVL